MPCGCLPNCFGACLLVLGCQIRRLLRRYQQLPLISPGHLDEEDQAVWYDVQPFDYRPNGTKSEDSAFVDSPWRLVTTFPHEGAT